MYMQIKCYHIRVCVCTLMCVKHLYDAIHLYVPKLKHLQRCLKQHQALQAVRQPYKLYIVAIDHIANILSPSARADSI